MIISPKRPLRGVVSIKTCLSPYGYRDSHYENKTVSRPPYLHKGNRHTRKDGLYIETGLGHFGRRRQVYDIIWGLIQYKDAILSVKDILLRPYCFCNGISYTGKTASLYWIKALLSKAMGYILPQSFISMISSKCPCAMVHLRFLTTQIARFMGPTWGPPGTCRPQMGPMLAPWTLYFARKCYFER